MLKKLIYTLISIIIIFVLTFVIWHFFLSIYEVKIVTDFPQNSLSINSTYKIDCCAVNSIGWELRWREVNPTIKTIEGEKLVETQIVANQIIVKTKSEKGIAHLELNSHFSLNPTRFILKIGLE